MVEIEIEFLIRKAVGCVEVYWNRNIRWKAVGKADGIGVGKRVYSNETKDNKEIIIGLKNIEARLVGLWEALINCWGIGRGKEGLGVGKGECCPLIDVPPISRPWWL